MSLSCLNFTINLEIMNAPSQGMLLIAEPFLKDPNFKRTVVLLCEHQEAGSFGFVLNREIEQTLEELLPDLEGMDNPVYYGGPVQKDTLHFLHQYPELIPGGFEVADGIYWGGDFDLAIQFLREQKIDPDKIRFFIGYSGWTGGQLELELKENSWLLTPALRKLVFHRKMDEVWKDSLRNMGGDYEIMINFPVDPSLN
jgi:putative transcriptional regulator